MAPDEAAASTDTPETSNYLARLQDNPETFAPIMEAGGRVLAGTDAPLDFVAIGLHSNLRSLAEGPMTPFQILQNGTSCSAAELGLSDELGTVEPGKIADLALVRGRPDETVEDLINVEMVVKGGRLYTVDELIEPFALFPRKVARRPATECARAELLLERHHQLDRVEAVGAQVVDEARVLGDLRLVHAEMLDHDLLDPL